jgi:hypothetical protein
MDKLCQVNTLMKVATNSHTVSVPVDRLHNGWSPLVPLLDVVEKRQTMSGIADIGLVVVGDSSIINLELSACGGK